MVSTINIQDNAIESPSAFFWMDKDGVLVIHCKQVDVHTLQHSKDNILIVTKLADNVKRPLLIDMTAIRSMSRDARQMYATTGSEQATAVALVTKSVASKVVGNFFMGFNKPIVPTKLFNDPISAKNWLLNHK